MKTTPAQVMTWISYVEEMRSTGNEMIILSDKDYYSRSTGFYSFMSDVYESHRAQKTESTVFHLNLPARNIDKYGKYLLHFTNMPYNQVIMLCSFAGITFEKFTKYVAFIIER